MSSFVPGAKCGRTLRISSVIPKARSTALRGHRSAQPGGIITHTGIAGLTLGGGLGWLMRRHGLTADNLLSADVVTADGEVLRADAEEHADLFWGLRGGGNFGVVTSFEYRLHPVGPTVLAGVILHPAAKAREVLGFYRDFVASAPDELTTIVILRMAPPAPFLPPEVHGQPVVVIGACYAGPVEEGERAVAPLRRFGAPWWIWSAPRRTPRTRHCSTPPRPTGSTTTGNRSTCRRSAMD